MRSLFPNTPEARYNRRSHLLPLLGTIAAIAAALGLTDYAAWRENRQERAQATAIKVDGITVQDGSIFHETPQPGLGEMNNEVMQVDLGHAPEGTTVTIPVKMVYTQNRGTDTWYGIPEDKVANTLNHHTLDKTNNKNLVWLNSQTAHLIPLNKDKE